MSITNEDIKKLSELARIDMTEEEQKEILGDLQEILGYVEQISEVATEEKKVMPGEHRNIMREDENPHEKGIYTKDILDEMPDTDKGYLKVKKILN